MQHTACAHLIPSLPLWVWSTAEASARILSQVEEEQKETRSRTITALCF